MEYCIRTLVVVALLAPLLGTRGAVAAPLPKAIIIAQPGSPVEIVSYSAEFQRRGVSASEGIHHSLQYRNRGTQKVVAVRFGLVSFDLFNRFIGKTGGIATDDLPPETLPIKGDWVASHYAAFSFLTGLAYVDAVRLEDDTVWQADETAILAEIRKIERDFDAKLLRESDATR